ncbi:hypothetical protein Hanom_Chr15g01364091 [Helianthus anomalus]
MHIFEMKDRAFVGTELHNLEPKLCLFTNSELRDRALGRIELHYAIWTYKLGLFLSSGIEPQVELSFSWRLKLVLVGKAFY